MYLTPSPTVWSFSASSSGTSVHLARAQDLSFDNVAEFISSIRSKLSLGTVVDLICSFKSQFVVKTFFELSEKTL
jgi:hypothetical protein